MSGECLEFSTVSERLDAAQTALTRERRRTTDELEALERFESRVQTIETISITQKRESHRTVLTHAPSDKGLDRVREAYEETVMTVPHYSDEYDDTYRQSLTAEFSPDVATALTDGTVFNDQCKQTTLAAVVQSIAVRESMLDGIDDEQDSIDSAADTLLPVIEELTRLRSDSFQMCRFGTLDAYRNRLTVLENKCETLSDQRQQKVFETRRARWIADNVPDIAQYFYLELDVDYPVMSSIADIVEAINKIRNEIEREMAFYDA